MKTNLRFSAATLTLAFLLTTLWVGQGHINWEVGNAKHAHSAVSTQRQKATKTATSPQWRPAQSSQQSSAL